MERLTSTPFGRRPVTLGLLAACSLAEAPAEIARIDKWELFRNLCAARRSFGVSDRDLTVLNALLSFHRSASLDEAENLIVFPSNAALSERAHGMAESTLRRHLATLVDAGLLFRHDSPNGKRYANRGAKGELVRAFGFDLRLLLVRAAEISQAALAAREADKRLGAVREEVVLALRDCAKLLEYAEDQDQILRPEILGHITSSRKMLRRKLGIADLERLHAAVGDMLAELSKSVRDPFEAGDPDGSDSYFERHKQNSETDSSDSEPHREKGKMAEATSVPLLDPKSRETEPASLPLALVVEACPDLELYAQTEVKDWHQLHRTTELLYSMMGVSPDAWIGAQATMGTKNAAVALACILQRTGEILSPGGYLRSLSRKAAEGRFSPNAMVMALLNSKRRRATGGLS